MIILIRFYLYIAQCSLFIPLEQVGNISMFVCEFFFSLASFDSVRLSFIGAENGGFQRIQNFSFAMVDSFFLYSRKYLFFVFCINVYFSLFFDLIFHLNSIEVLWVILTSLLDLISIVFASSTSCFSVFFSENARKLFMKIERKTQYG